MDLVVVVPKYLFVIEEVVQCSCPENKPKEPFCGNCGKSNAVTAVKRFIRENPLESSEWEVEEDNESYRFLVESYDHLDSLNLAVLKQLAKEAEQKIEERYNLTNKAKAMVDIDCIMKLSVTISRPKVEPVESPTFCKCKRNRRDDLFCNQCGQSNRRTKLAYESTADISVYPTGEIRSIKGYKVRELEKDSIEVFTEVFDETKSLREILAIERKMVADFGVPVKCWLGESY